MYSIKTQSNQFVVCLCNLTNTFILHYYDSDGDGNPLVRHRQDRRRRAARVPVFNLHFNSFMMDRIRTYWIPLVESLSIANGRSAHWNRQKSLIYFEGEEWDNI